MTDQRSWRARVTRRTAVYAAFLGGLPLWVPLVAVAALTAAGFLVGGTAGGVLLLAVAAVAGWLAVLRWDHLTPGGRLVRVVVLTGLVALALRDLA